MRQIPSLQRLDKMLEAELIDGNIPPLDVPPLSILTRSLTKRKIIWLEALDDCKDASLSVGDPTVAVDTIKRHEQTFAAFAFATEKRIETIEIKGYLYTLIGWTNEDKTKEGRMTFCKCADCINAGVVNALTAQAIRGHLKTSDISDHFVGYLRKASPSKKRPRLSPQSPLADAPSLMTALSTPFTGPGINELTARVESLSLELGKTKQELRERSKEYKEIKQEIDQAKQDFKDMVQEIAEVFREVKQQLDERSKENEETKQNSPRLCKIPRT